ncbi:MAG: amidohydrolase family protein [Kiritimatiellaeota bacterium]|nr:amidohydrolase family protein [Kiritimatiellota bacterium]
MTETKAILHATLIDGTGAPPSADSAVVVRGQRVEAVGHADELAIPPDAEVVDAAGTWLMPGIIEAHAHVGGDGKAQQVLRLSLQRGITTVCSVSANTSGIELSRAIEAGWVRGCARLIPACVVSCTHGHVRFRTADGPWEVRKAVRETVSAGARFIKTAASGGFWAENETCAARNYTYEELEALVDEAHAWDIPVAVHCHTQPGLDYCIRAGADQIHHGAFIDEVAVRGMAEKGIFFIPTLAVTCQRNIDASGAERPWMVREMQDSQLVHREGVRLARELGVKVGVGTDYPGGHWWQIGERTMVELQELVACGYTPMEALVAATRTNAAAFRLLDDLGTLEPGKRADLVLVSGNPLDDISLLARPENILLVMKDGVVEATEETYKRHYRVKEAQPDA